MIHSFMDSHAHVLVSRARITCARLQADKHEDDTLRRCAEAREEFHAFAYDSREFTGVHRSERARGYK